MTVISSKPVSSRVLDAAIAWQLSLDSGDGSLVEREEFDKWLASNDEHARAWRQLGMLDQRFSAASGPARAALLQSREGIRQRVRKLGSGLASIALVVGLALFAGERYVPIHYWLADQRTATGEQRTLKLADGTLINLNTHSAIDVRFDEKRRLIVLQEGEILVETGHNDARPFYVQTRDGSLRALGTRFIVKREDDATRLSVLQSAVAAQPEALHQEQIFKEGQQVLMRSDGLDLAIIQPLLRGAGWDATTAPLRLSRLSEQANRLNLKATVAQTISQIIATYRELLRAQEQLSIVQDALKRSGTLLEVNKALISAGRMAEFEIVQTEADIATQQLGVEEAQNQLDTSRLSLLRLLALDLSTPVRATEALEARPMQIDKRQAFNLAQTQQPEYLAALLGSQQADLNLVIAKDSGRWQVDLVTGANQVRAASDNDAGRSNNRTWDSYAGVQVQIPIGDISTRQAEVRARVNVEDQEIRTTDARQELERSVNDVVRDLGTRWRQYEISQRAVELSRRKIEIEREKLSAGRSTNFQVLSFETDLRNAENAQLNALIAYLNAQTQLDLTLGMTLESWEIALNDY